MAYYVEFLISGTSPLLLHSPQSMKGTGTGDAPTPSRGKTIPTPEDEAEQAAYRLPNGFLGFPAVGVRKSLLTGCRGLTILPPSGSGRRLGARPFLAGAMLIGEEFFPLSSDGQDIKDYEIDSRRAVIQRAGIIRNRPRIDPPWEIRCQFLHDPSGVTAAGLVSLVEAAAATAGRTIGIGDYRIEKDGWFGAYQLSQVSIVED